MSNKHQEAFAIYLSHNPSAAKTVSIIEELLSDMEASNPNQAAIANKFKVSRGYVTHLKSRYGIQKKEEYQSG